MRRGKTDDIVGVDGCRAGWVAVRIPAEGFPFTLSVHENFTDVLERHSDAWSIAVDIPIGLSERFAPRCCDQEARLLLGPRRSSVFAAPDRSLLRCATYAEAGQISRDGCGKGISQQAFHIFRKIAEVDALMTPVLQKRVFECHPELCFRVAAEQTPCRHSKRTAEGYDERRSILERALRGIAIPERSRIARGLRGVQPDDILDALAAAWTARRHSHAQEERIPAVAEFDPRGLRMEIVF